MKRPPEDIIIKAKEFYVECLQNPYDNVPGADAWSSHIESSERGSHPAYSINFWDSEEVDDEITPKVAVYPVIAHDSRDIETDTTDWYEIPEEEVQSWEVPELTHVRLVDLCATDLKETDYRIPESTLCRAQGCQIASVELKAYQQVEVGFYYPDGTQGTVTLHQYAEVELFERPENTWQSYTLGTSNLTEAQKCQVVEALNKCADQIQKDFGITIEYGADGDVVTTDSGTY